MSLRSDADGMVVVLFVDESRCKWMTIWSYDRVDDLVSVFC